MRKLFIIIFFLYIIYLIFFFYLKDDLLLRYYGIEAKLQQDNYRNSLAYFDDYKLLVPWKKNFNYALFLFSVITMAMAIFTIRTEKQWKIQTLGIVAIILSFFVILIAFVGMLMSGYSYIV